MIKNSLKLNLKGCEKMLEYDEMRIKLQGLEKNITELRDSL